MGVTILPNVFFSYCHADEALRDQLEKQLSMLKRQRVIETWHDRRIGAGQEIDAAIDDHINSDEIILLLVSPDFIASDYCYNIEMARAMERHAAKEAIVIPVILRPCDWHHAPFGKLLGTPQDGKPVTLWPNQDEAFLQVAKEVRKAAERCSLGITGASARSDRDDFSVGAAPFPSTTPGPRSSNLRMAKSSQEALPPPVITPPPVKSRLYDCGKRVGILRASLAMLPSRFIELVDYGSEKRLAFLESGTVDMSESEIASVCEATGVSEEWLIHAKGSMFPIESLATYHWTEIKKLKEADPKAVHMLVNGETQQLVMLAHLHSKNWKIYGIVPDLNFAGWWGDHHQIPEVYDMLKQLADDYRGRIYGRIIDPKAFANILSGDMHPAFFLANTHAAGARWFDDIFDYSYRYSMAENYEALYGKWFTTAQDYFRRYAVETSPVTVT